MACEVNCPQQLTIELVDDLANIGLNLSIQVDCSHAQNFQTWPQGQPTRVTIAKAIELDTELSLTGAQPLPAVLAALAAAPATSELGTFYTCVQSVIANLATRHIKVGFANFNTNVVDLADAALAPIVALCQAANAAAFNAEPTNIRKSMGMYLRRMVGGAPQYNLIGGMSPQPRVA